MSLTDAQFAKCSRAVDLLEQRREVEGRDEVIDLLSEIPLGQNYGELLNSLIRRCGLLPYMQLKSANWSDRFVCEAFKVDGGNDLPVVLHREQSLVLKKLLSGESLAISAPTSFGKSFIVDAFIAMKRPSTVVIIVPTIALSDEIRRRLQKKFGAAYKIITTAGVSLGNRSILVCPAERIAGYIESLKDIDLLIVDEFYKADIRLDKDRSPALLKAMLRLSPKAKQRYYLAPHVKHLEVNAFTEGMEFLPLDFKTVILRVVPVYEKIGNDASSKEAALLDILKSTNENSLIYAGTHASVDSVGKIILDDSYARSSKILQLFASWLEKNYGVEWDLPDLIRCGTGIHTGRLHRFLGQIQVHLFEREDGLRNIISTSSIVEGVNTQAKNVIIWKSKNGPSNLKDFTYRNIIGRGGRAFRHFVGNVYLLDRPPEKEDTSLQLDFSDNLLSNEPEVLDPSVHITSEQIARIASYKADMRRLLGVDSYDEAVRSGRFVSTDAELLRRIANSVRNQEWNGIGYLNGYSIDRWDRFLYKAIEMDVKGWEVKFSVVVNFVKALSYNWDRTIPQIISMQGRSVSINMFFALERSVVFRLHSILSDVNTMNVIVNSRAIDISPFLSRLSSAFLPRFVYDLEEYGLPRMISKKLSMSGVFDFNGVDVTLHEILGKFNEMGFDGILKRVGTLTDFEKYLLNYFLDGIKSRPLLISG